MENKVTHTHTHNHFCRNKQPFCLIKSAKSLLVLLIISLICSLTSSKASASTPIVVAGGETHCPYTDITITTGLSNPSIKIWRAVYEWTFDDGSPGSYSGIEFSDPLLPSTPKNPGPITWEDEGTFEVTLTVSVYNSIIGGTLVSQNTYTATVTIDATCCASEITAAGKTLSGTLSTNATYDGVWYVNGDLTIDADITVNGTWLVKGNVNMSDPPSVTGHLITVNSNDELNVYYGEIRGECENMWMGIKMEENSDIHVEFNSTIKDMWKGVHPNGNDEFFFTFNNATFMNNRIGISSNQTNLGGSSQRIFNSTFSSNDDFLYPYDGGDHISWKHVEIRGDYSYITSFANNELSNAFVGLDFKSTFPATAMFPRVKLENNTFENIYLAGARLIKTNEVIVDGNEFALTSDQSDGSGQLSDFLTTYTDFNSSRRIGLEIGDVDNEYCDIKNNTFLSDGLDYDFSETEKRIGILYSPINPAYSTSSYTEFTDNTIDGMHYGIYIDEDDGSSLFVENIFTDNEYSLFFTGNSDSYVHNLECNEFNKTSNTSSTSTHGLYIESGSTIGNIGTDAVMDRGNYNKWAVDVTSSGYPGSYPSDDPKNWDPPSNWFSIYDENASSETSPNINYYVYKNIYVGDKSASSTTDAVFPSSMIQRGSPPNNNVNADACPTFTLPTFRIGGKMANAEQMGADINIYPNPSDGYIKVNSSVNIDSYGIYSMEGIELKSEEMPLQNRLYLNDLPKGLYILRLIESGGKVTSYKLEIL